jgi:prevent-host-death family protein
MIRLSDIYSLSEFQRRTKEHVRRLRETGRPTVLTVNGRAELVVHDAASYQELMDSLERAGSALASESVDATELDLEPDPIIEEYKTHVDRTLLRENLRRTVEERVAGLVALQALAAEAQRAGEEAR